MASVLELAQLSEAVYHTETPDDFKNATKGFRAEKAFGDPKSGYHAVFFRKIANEEPILAIRGTDPTQMSDLGADAQLAVGSVPHQFYDVDKHIRGLQDLASGRAFYVTGHSLGGGLSSLVGAKYRLPTVTFNAPGMKNSYATLVCGASPASISGLAMAASPPMGMYAPVGMPSLEASKQLMDDIKKREEAKKAIDQLDTAKMLNVRASGDLVSVGTGPAMGKVEKVTINAGATNVVVTAVTTYAFPFIGPLVGGGMFALDQHSMTNVVKAVAVHQKYHMDLGWLSAGAAPVPVPKTATPTTAQRVHIVAPGESLSLIAQKYYNDVKKWTVIYAVPANKVTIGPNPNLVRVGMKLIVP